MKALFMDEVSGLAIGKMLDKKSQSTVKTQIYKKHDNIRCDKQYPRNGDVQSKRDARDTTVEINWILQNNARCSTTEYEQILLI